MATRHDDHPRTSSDDPSQAYRGDTAGLSCGPDPGRWRVLLPVLALFLLFLAVLAYGLIHTAREANRIDEERTSQAVTASVELTFRRIAAQSLVQASVAVARALDMQVVAEGVETETQAQLMREAGCDHLQGWLFSRAVPADQVGRLVQAPSLEAELGVA